MASNKYIIVLLLLLFTFAEARSQLSIPFAFGGIGSPQSTMSSFSGPLTFQSRSTCFQVSNGVFVMTAQTLPGNAFRMECPVINEDNVLNLVAFPNPATDQITIQTRHFISTDNAIFIILMDMAGNRLGIKQITASELRSGYSYSLSSMSAGSYILTVKSGNTTYNFKFIKTHF